MKRFTVILDKYDYDTLTNAKSVLGVKTKSQALRMLLRISGWFKYLKNK